MTRAVEICDAEIGRNVWVLGSGPAVVVNRGYYLTQVVWLDRGSRVPTGLETVADCTLCFIGGWSRHLNRHLLPESHIYPTQAPRVVNPTPCKWCGYRAETTLRYVHTTEDQKRSAIAGIGGG